MSSFSAAWTSDIVGSMPSSYGYMDWRCVKALYGRLKHTDCYSPGMSDLAKLAVLPTSLVKKVNIGRNLIIGIIRSFMYVCNDVRSQFSVGFSF